MLEVQNAAAGVLYYLFGMLNFEWSLSTLIYFLSPDYLVLVITNGCLAYMVQFLYLDIYFIVFLLICS